MAAAMRRTITVRAASRLPVPMYPQGRGTSGIPWGVVSRMTTARMSENANTALHSPAVSRPNPHEAAMTSAAARRISRNTRLLVTKQAMAMSTAPMSFTQGFMRCRKLSPGTYSRNLAISRSPPLPRLRPPYRMPELPPSPFGPRCSPRPPPPGSLPRARE